MPSLLKTGVRARKLKLHDDVVRRYRILAAYEGLTTVDAIDLALREALERRGLPEEQEDAPREEP